MERISFSSQTLPSTVPAVEHANNGAVPGSLQVVVEQALNNSNNAAASNQEPCLAFVLVPESTPIPRCPFTMTPKSPPEGYTTIYEMKPFNGPMTVSMSGKKDISDAEAMQYLSNIPVIRGLDLDNCSELSDGVLRQIAEKCEDLFFLNLRSVDNVSKTTLRLFATRCKDLTTLCLPEQTDEATLRLFARRCRGLKGLIILSQAEDTTILDIAGRCNGLKFLYIASRKISEDTLRTLARQCDSVEKLGLPLRKIDPDTFNLFKSHSHPNSTLEILE